MNYISLTTTTVLDMTDLNTYIFCEFNGMHSQRVDSGPRSQRDDVTGREDKDDAEQIHVCHVL